ncbi:signal peptidase I, putative [Acanthamoeba castellanii str. Neff]|uniref:Mitochondrial inner membrane protease subunit n=1 Tax=Acanthamoeba castellanii (strain ATCC 30010 / Neff) TaxID=1257118 RepID=L8GYF2_ACACF|nr:signal peptidase I, putative [Acanthamoeba castellanii str. Neff]ELR17101.1 signal peptidase I, putative [Acanthamoeba castellanii str. Neff]
MESGGGSRLGAVLRTTIMVGAYYGVAYTFCNTVLKPSTTAGPSMHPTFNAAGDSVWVYRRIDPATDLRVGDIVHARTPTYCRLEGKQPGVLKRIKGLPGDTIKVTFYSPSKVGRTEAEEEADEVTIKVPAGHVWVEGDNPGQSTDSRMWGPLPLALIEGKVVSRLNPFSLQTLDAPGHIKRKWERQARDIADSRATGKRSGEEALRAIDRLIKSGSEASDNTLLVSDRHDADVNDTALAPPQDTVQGHERVVA